MADLASKLWLRLDFQNFAQARIDLKSVAGALVHEYTFG